MNKKTDKGWALANIAGHSMSKGIYKISRNEGFTLMHCGLINITQLFPEQEYTKK